MEARSSVSADKFHSRSAAALLLVLVLVDRAAHLLAGLIHVLCQLPIGLFGLNLGFIQCHPGIMLQLFRGLVRLRTGPFGIALGTCPKE